jgi:hypothetical protein
MMETTVFSMDTVAPVQEHVTIGGAFIDLFSGFREDVSTNKYQQTEKGYMQFVLAVLLFVVVIGLLDARVPWPKPRNRRVRP